MKDQEIEDELIWSFIDNSMNQYQKEEFEKRLTSEKQLKTRYEELLKLDDFTKKGLLATPSALFTERIMQRIQQVKIQPKRSHWLILLGVLVTILVGATYLSEFNTQLILDMNQVNLPSVKDYLPTTLIEVDRNLPIDAITKGLLYLMSFLSLIFFDRAILKPYFKGRRMTN